MVATEQNSPSYSIPAPPPHLHVIAGQPVVRSTGDYAPTGNMALLREAGDRRHAARGLAELCAAPLEVALSHLVLAGLSMATGDIARARDLLASARTSVETIEAELPLECVVHVQEQVASEANPTGSPALAPRARGPAARRRRHEQRRHR